VTPGRPALRVGLLAVAGILAALALVGGDVAVTLGANRAALILAFVHGYGLGPLLPLAGIGAAIALNAWALVSGEP
jgi:hypothetical protein